MFQKKTFFSFFLYIISLLDVNANKSTSFNNNNETSEINKLQKPRARVPGMYKEILIVHHSLKFTL